MVPLAKADPVITAVKNSFAGPAGPGISQITPRWVARPVSHPLHPPGLAPALPGHTLGRGVGTLQPCVVVEPLGLPWVSALLSDLDCRWEACRVSDAGTATEFHCTPSISSLFYRFSLLI